MDCILRQVMRNRWHNGGATIEEEAEDCEDDEAGQYRALNTTLELDLGEWTLTLGYPLLGLRAKVELVTNWIAV